MSSLKKTAVATAVVATVIFGAGRAQAGGDAAAVIGYLQAAFFTMVQGMVSDKINGSTNTITQTFREVMAQSTGMLSGEITKSALANKAVLEGIEGMRQQEELRRDALKMQSSLEMPANTCQDMAVQDGLAKASASTQAAMLTSQGKVTAALKGNTNTMSLVNSRFAKTNEKFCSAEDGARGLCTYKADNELSGADQEAAFLFQARSGSRTYAAPEEGPSQYEATGDYVARMVVGIPPEQLRTKDLDKTPQGKAYIELVRRYNGMASMAAYSLNQIRESGNPIKGLGSTTKMANVEGFAPEVDMSMNEAVRRFVHTQFSPKVVQDLATATQPEKILRAMATQNAFGLWLDYQGMEQNSRMEAMLASQLALAAESSLRPQIDAQRVVASRASKPAAPAQ